MTEILRETIASCTLFSHLEEAEIADLLAASTLETLAAGDSIIAEGKPVQNLYIVASGEVHVSTNALGRDVDLQTLTKGSYFGEVSLMSGKNATATVEAKSDAVEVVAIKRDAISALVGRDETVRKVLEGVTLERAKDTLGKVLK